MPGRLFLETPLSEIAAWCGVAEGPDISISPRRNISPGQDILVLSPDGHLRTMRWGMIPVGRVNARGRPVLETIINARSESLFAKSAFLGVGRGIVPCQGWYEWTAEDRRKRPWRIRPASGGLMAFAAITDNWSAPGGRSIDQVATVTCQPNKDVEKIHHRMGVILAPAQFEVWLNGSEDEARSLMKPLAEGELVIEPASDVDWAAP